jgi:NAD(P)H-flavin reductase
VAGVGAGPATEVFTIPAPSRAGPWSGLLRIARIFEEALDVKTFRFTAPDGGPVPFSYLPGQFLSLTVRQDGKPVRRS